MSCCFTGAHVLIAQLGRQPTTASEVRPVIGRPRDVLMQRLNELVERCYVEQRGNRYKLTTN
jgi:predicted transcriptional regulator